MAEPVINLNLAVQPYMLAQRQSLSLRAKIDMSERRIREWHDHYEGDVYVAFSGGKDSTVLLDIVRGIYPKVPAVFCDTGLEYPEIRDFVKTIDNVTWLRPKIPFTQVIEKYGYPVISKEVAQKIYEVRNTKSAKLKYKRMNGDDNKYRSGKIPDKWRPLILAPFKISSSCCDVMKKRPFHLYEHETGRTGHIGTMADDSHFRRQSYLRSGCNAFAVSSPRSTPLSFWLEKDIWKYIKQNDLPYSEIYDMGYDRTGCMFCMFGAHMEDEPNRFQRMAKTHPKAELSSG